MPKDIAEELGLSEGTTVTFESRKDVVIMKKVTKEKDALHEMMLWNPTRMRRPKPVRESEVKEIWD